MTLGLSVSIVSHGHGAPVAALLAQLAALDAPRPQRVLLTLNRPEPELARGAAARGWPFELDLIENPQPASFAANHNRAFAADQRSGHPSAVFAVVNPDVALRGNPFAPILQVLAETPHVGAAYPAQVDASGAPQDHERRVPTPRNLVRRYARRALGRPDAEVPPGQAPDWVNAAFLCFRSSAYAALGGFDERFAMYCEDVDLCLRLQLAGWTLARVEGALIEHAAQRASHRHPRYLAWHVRSLVRLWRSQPYADYLARRRPMRPWERL